MSFIQIIMSIIIIIYNTDKIGVVSVGLACIVIEAHSECKACSCKGSGDMLPRKIRPRESGTEIESGSSFD